VQGTAARASALGLALGIVALAPGGALTVDVESFEAAATAAHNSKDARVYRVALDLCAGELLPEDRYEDWAARPRERLHDLQLGMLSELARLQQQRGERAAALGTLSRLVAEVPTHEDARTRLMTMYATAGQRQQALREYARLRTALREELDVEPGATAQRVYARDPRRQRASSSNQDWRPPARTGARRLASRRASVGRTDAHDEGQLWAAR
jgi:DNA-binding SARP family transcriptional activator